MVLIDWLCGGWRWYRRMRGGRWMYASCVDGGWLRDDPSAPYPEPDVEDYEAVSPDRIRKD